MKERIHLVRQDEEGKLFIAELTEKGYEDYNAEPSPIGAPDGTWKEYTPVESTIKLIKRLGLKQA